MTKERTYGMWAACLMATLVAQGKGGDEAFAMVQKLSTIFGNSTITETTLKAMSIELAEMLEA